MKTTTPIYQSVNNDGNFIPIEAVNEAARNNIIKYAIFPSRMQPMHKGHFECLETMASAGITPIFLIGSCNESEEVLDGKNYGQFFQPSKNPLTFQQQQVLRFKAWDDILSKLTDVQKDKLGNPFVIRFPDVGNKDKWIKMVNAVPEQCKIDKNSCAYFYVAKDVDQKNNKSAIESLSKYAKDILASGMPVWQGLNKTSEYNNISATPLRVLSSDCLEQTCETVVYGDQLKKWADEAKDQVLNEIPKVADANGKNLFSEKQNQDLGNCPASLQFCSLLRIIREAEKNSCVKEELAKLLKHDDVDLSIAGSADEKNICGMQKLNMQFDKAWLEHKQSKSNPPAHNLEQVMSAVWKRVSSFFKIN